MALADSKTLKAMVEFREASKGRKIMLVTKYKNPIFFQCRNWFMIQVWNLEYQYDFLLNPNSYTFVCSVSCQFFIYLKSQLQLKSQG